MAADACESSYLQLARINLQTAERLRSFLPPMASFYNPIDIVGDAHVERYEKALGILMDDKDIDAILVLLTPTATIEVKETARAIIEHAENRKKPILCCFMGEVQIEKAVKLLKNMEFLIIFPQRML